MTGLGIISPVGSTVKSAWEAILKGESGISPITRFDVSAFPVRFGGAVRGFDVGEYISPKEARRMDEFMHYGVAAGIQAMTDSGIDMSKLDANRCGAVCGAGIGGLAELKRRANANLAVLEAWVDKTPWVDFLPETKATRSNTSVCLKVVDPRVTGLSDEAQADFAKKLAAALEKEDVAYDVAGYRDAPPGLRIWCGATVDASDLEALTPWLDWSFHATAAELAPA